MKKLLKYKIFVLLLLLLSLPIAGFSENYFYNKIDELAVQLLESKNGSVLSVDGDTVYIDIGQNDDVAPGNKFDVIRPGEAIKKDNTVIGFKETKISEIKIENIRDGFSICSIIKKGQSIKKGDKLIRKSHKITKIIVSEFSFVQGSDHFAYYVTDTLSSCFIKKGLKVVSREKKDDVIKNSPILSGERAPNFKTIQNIGRLFDVDGVVTGSITNINGSIIINASVFEVDNGNAVSAGWVEIKKTPQIVDLIKKYDKMDRPENNFAKGKKQKEKKFVFTFGKSLRKGKYYENSYLCATVTSMRKRNGNIEIDLVYENLADYNIPLKIKDIKSVYLLDENNKRWNFKTDTAGIHKWGKSLLRNTKLKTRLFFIPDKDAGGTLFSLYMDHVSPNDFNLVIHDISPL